MRKVSPQASFEQTVASYTDRSIKEPESSSFKSKSKVIDKKSFDRESAKAQKIRLQANSPFGHLRSWNLIRVMVKSIDDVRQEQFAM